jgi:hypothetical protein
MHPTGTLILPDLFIGHQKVLTKDTQQFRNFSQNCWLSGLLPSSSILETRKCNVSETGSVSLCR